MIQDEVRPKPISVKGATAAQMLDIDYSKLANLMDQGVFTVLTEDGKERKPGTRVFLLTAEIEVYGRTRSAEAVRRYRETSTGKSPAASSA